MAEPPLKWVGAKRWLVAKHASLLVAPVDTKRLGLPFCGGGAVAFHYAAAAVPVLMSDTNDRLIVTYKAIRDGVDAVVDALRAIEAGGYTRQNFETARGNLNATTSAPLAERAAWFVTVNRWGFNGLWRVNGKGQCNVPFGKPSKAGTVPRLYVEANLRACSRALRHARIEALDFDEQLARMQPGPGDFVYLDPPYVPVSATANFVGYTAGGFGPKDQQRLVASLERLDASGARWALSNSDTHDARALYQRPNWNLLRLERSGGVSCDTSDRGAVGEILVRNYV